MVVVYFLRGLVDTLMWLGAAAFGIGVVAGIIRGCWMIFVKPIDDSESRMPRTMSQPKDAANTPT